MSQYEKSHERPAARVVRTRGSMTVPQFATPASISTATVNPMFSRVLLAIDFDPASLAAARWATAHLAPHTDAVLMHVAADDPLLRADAEPVSEDEYLERMTPALARGLDGFGATLDVATSRSVVRGGRPSASLASVANDAEVSLLVLGRRADANRNRVGEPNVIERVTRRTSASVLVVPEGTTHPPDHIVAAVDDSRFAPHVLRVAGQLARMHEAALTVLHVVPPVAGPYERVIRPTKHPLSRTGAPSDLAVERRAAPATLAPSTPRWVMQLGHGDESFGRLSTEIAIGDPAREIVRTAMEREAPLVVVGLRGADEAPAGSLGSVARELLTRGPMPVLAVNVV